MQTMLNSSCPEHWRLILYTGIRAMRCSGCVHNCIATLICRVNFHLHSIRFVGCASTEFSIDAWISDRFTSVRLAEQIYVYGMYLKWTHTPKKLTWAEKIIINDDEIQTVRKGAKSGTSLITLTQCPSLSRYEGNQRNIHKLTHRRTRQHMCWVSNTN